MSQGPAKDVTKLLAMPGNVRAVHVIGLLDELGELGSGTHANVLAEKIGADIAVFLPILNAAEMLGLLRSENGDLFLTEDGMKLQETTMAKVSVFLKDKLSSIEPFATAIGLASQEGGTTAKQVADTLMKQGVQWDYKPDVNESMVKNLLIHWGIRADLLAYNGKNGTFQAPAR